MAVGKPPESRGHGSRLIRALEAAVDRHRFGLPAGALHCDFHAVRMEADLTDLAGCILRLESADDPGGTLIELRERGRHHDGEQRGSEYGFQHALLYPFFARALAWSIFQHGRPGPTSNRGAVKREMTDDIPALIPRTVLLGNPERTSPQLSPDGRRLVFLAPADGVLAVWLQTVGADDARVVAKDAARPIRNAIWVPQFARTAARS